MKRTKVFIFRVDVEERKLISLLAHHLQRSQSDAIRLLVREAVKAILNNDEKTYTESSSINSLIHNEKDHEPA